MSDKNKKSNKIGNSKANKKKYKSSAGFVKKTAVYVSVIALAGGCVAMSMFQGTYNNYSTSAASTPIELPSSAEYFMREYGSKSSTPQINYSDDVQTVTYDGSETEDGIEFNSSPVAVEVSP